MVPAVHKQWEFFSITKKQLGFPSLVYVIIRARPSRNQRTVGISAFQAYLESSLGQMAVPALA
jgi:hypothetical protein